VIEERAKELSKYPKWLLEGMYLDAKEKNNKELATLYLLALELHNPIGELIKYRGVRGVALVRFKDTGKEEILTKAMAYWLRDKGRVEILKEAEHIWEL